MSRTSTACRTRSRSCSNENSGVWTPTTISPSSRYAFDHARTYGSWRSRLVHVSVQKFTSTTWPRSSAGPRGGGGPHSVAPPHRGALPTERGHLHTREHRHLAKRAERSSHLGREELRLLPGGEVAAPVDLVEVREVGVGHLDPAARGSPDLVGERREGDRYGRRRRGLNGEAGPCSSVLPVVPGGGASGAGQPVEGDVVDDVLLCQVPGRPAVDERAGDLVVAVRVVVEHPGREGDG